MVWRQGQRRKAKVVQPQIAAMEGYLLTIACVQRIPIRIIIIPLCVASRPHVRSTSSRISPPYCTLDILLAPARCIYRIWGWNKKTKKFNAIVVMQPSSHSLMQRRVHVDKRCVTTIQEATVPYLTKGDSILFSFFCAASRIRARNVALSAWRGGIFAAGCSSVLAQLTCSNEKSSGNQIPLCCISCSFEFFFFFFF